MLLKDYPAAIAQSDRNLSKVQRLASNAKRKLEEQQTLIDCEIAFSDQLKNDAQRKARKMQMMQADEYQEVAELYRELSERLEDLTISHQELINSFSVAKLELRESVARMESQSYAA